MDGRAARLLGWLVLVCALPARSDLITGVDAARLLGVPRVSRRMAHTDPRAASPGIVRVLTDGTEVGLVDVYRDEALARAAEEALGAGPERVVLRLDNLVCATSPARATALRARLAHVVSRGSVVPQLELLLEPREQFPFVATGATAGLDLRGTSSLYQVLPPAGAWQAPGAAGLGDLFEGQDDADYWHSSLTHGFTTPGLARAEVWLADQRNVVTRVGGEFTVFPPPTAGNEWLSAWALGEAGLVTDADRREVAEARRRLWQVLSDRPGRPVRGLREGRWLRSQLAALAKQVQPQWLPPAALVQFHGARQATCLYRGGTARLAWVADAEFGSCLYVEENLPRIAYQPQASPQRVVCIGTSYLEQYEPRSVDKANPPGRVSTLLVSSERRTSAPASPGKRLVWALLASLAVWVVLAWPVGRRAVR